MYNNINIHITKTAPMSSQITAKESVRIQDVENDQFIISQNISLHSVTAENEEQQMVCSSKPDSPTDTFVAIEGKLLESESTKIVPVSLFQETKINTFETFDGHSVSTD